MISHAKQFSFHPITVLIISVLASATFALIAYFRYEGEFRDLLVYYFAPIGMPFIAYVFDRVEHHQNSIWFIDLPVLAISLVRSFYPLPFISGHALFLTFALLTTRSWVARGTAFLILLQVACLKIFVWHDGTLFGGIMVGMLASVFHYWF